MANTNIFRAYIFCKYILRYTIMQILQRNKLEFICCVKITSGV